jgi:hypothetical protein
MRSLPEVSKRIDYIFRKYYYDICGRKINHILQEGSNNIRALSLDPNRFDWGIDKYRVRDVAISYYFDVIKYKEYHFNPKSETEKPFDPFSDQFMDAIHLPHADTRKDKVISTPKVAAFTAKWLLKYMPIYIFPRPNVSPSAEEKEKISNINIIFVLEHSLGLMGRNAEHQIKENIDDLLYHLKYRSIDDRSLILAFSILHRS